MDFHVGQKVIINCEDAEYMEDRAIENGMVGTILNIKESRRFPVEVAVNSHIAPVECHFKFDELKPAVDSAKIV